MVWVSIRAILALEDGTILEGNGFGYPTEVTGEVVFNTGMVGYPESLTDPSYYGQILVQTYPLIGNYGKSSVKITDKFGIPLHFESNKIRVTGYVISELQTNPSHWAEEKTLDEWLKEDKVPGICGIDTRELTKKLRIKGVMLGILKVAEEIDIEEIKSKINSIEDPNKRNLVKSVSVENPIEYNSGNSPKVVLIDCGVKFGIIRNLLEKNVDLTRVPYDFPVEKILGYEPSGIVISNGPGDPKKCEKTIETVKSLSETDIPIMGICLGNQILALASGGDTFKLKFGHRAQNHPCIDLLTKRCYITTQNHGYAVDPSSLSESGFEVSFINANDKTVEGIRHKTKPVFGTQFHPEASPGPYETEFLFDNFIEEVIKFQKRNG
ncbi:glutamine-hydrolyzing carbamoyl-phosphate synthase small subunit [archaeon]|nr:glutamine-hydrolyzing carbamoyl-phosphate synthase small subunit [archaeon]